MHINVTEALPAGTLIYGCVIKKGRYGGYEYDQMTIVRDGDQVSLRLEPMAHFSSLVEANEMVHRDQREVFKEAPWYSMPRQPPAPPRPPIEADHYAQPGPMDDPPRVVRDMEHPGGNQIIDSLTDKLRSNMNGRLSSWTLFVALLLGAVSQRLA
jgi:hypothetical protein